MERCRNRYPSGCTPFRIDIAIRIFLVIGILVQHSNGESYGNMSKLHSDLMVNYNRDVRPLQNQSHTLDVNVLYTLKSFIDFDAVNGRMVTTGSLFVTWRDVMMTWIPSDYGGIERVRMRETVVWAPTFVVANGAEDIYINGIKHEDSSILYNSTGIASYLMSGVMTTTCDPDITYYPYDVHKCILQFTTQEPMNEVRLYLTNIYILPGADSNLLWKLDNSEIQTYTVHNTNTFIEVTLTVERRPTYLIYNIILPVCLLNFINLLAFVLPADSGERVSFATTILLTLSVYMTIMSDSIPNTSDPVSILKISLMIKLITSSLIVFTVIVTLNIYRLSDIRPIPLWLLRMLCFYRKIRLRDSKADNVFEVSDIEFEHPKETATSNDDIDHDAGKQHAETWPQIGRSLDYMMLVIFSLMTVTETIFNMVRITCQIG